MLLGVFTATITRIEEHCRRRPRAGKRPVVAHIGPQSAGRGLALRQDRHGGVMAKPIVLKLPDRELELLDQQPTVLRFALRSSAALSAARCVRMRACALARSVGSQSSRLIANEWNHKPIRLRTSNRVVIHNAAISPLPAGARSAAASANQYLRAGSRAAPA